jgi:hypothetical protein
MRRLGICRGAPATLAAVLLATAAPTQGAVAAASAMRIQNVMGSNDTPYCLYRNKDDNTVQMDYCGGHVSGLWYFQAVTSTPDNDYRIVSAEDTGYCLDHHYTSYPTQPSNQLYAWRCSGNDNQRWVVTYRGPGNVIQSPLHWWCLSHSYFGNPPYPSSTVVATSDCHMRENQQWYTY